MARLGEVMVDDDGSAERLLGKLRQFIAGLDPADRSLLASLLAPGVAEAWVADGVDDVSGHMAGANLVEWRPGRLPEYLADAVRSGRLRIEIEDSPRP